MGPNPVDDPLLPPIQVDENLVTPGVIGFVVTLLVAVGAILLIIDMSRRVRRVRYRGEVRERLEEEQASAAVGRVEGDDEDPRPVA
ncbi:MAG: hypothetical protein KJ659_07405 [Actinobacteria bacterium]|nr:hypothetical protein [Actinomycetota bacterium]MBU1610120.1 hypothetical protein [Actinomycetota bacterium]MBU2315512.1 hypothetical protein [Actinomycetota bacterium]MBU2385313.1 hypothetical protein [Actinomycetota bacterium]QOD94799.1 hypothetical protein IE160_02835 [Chryseoglobus sp. 28M-23]